MLDILEIYIRNKIRRFFWKQIFPLVWRHRKNIYGVYWCFYFTFCYYLIYFGFGFLNPVYKKFILITYAIIAYCLTNQINASIIFFLLTFLTINASDIKEYTPYSGLFTTFYNHLENHPVRLGIYYIIFAISTWLGLTCLDAEWRGITITLFYSCVAIYMCEVLKCIEMLHIEKNFPIRFGHVVINGILNYIVIDKVLLCLENSPDYVWPLYIIYALFFYGCFSCWLFAAWCQGKLRLDGF